MTRRSDGLLRSNRMLPRRAWIPPALVALVALAVHGRTLAFGYVDLDDRDLVVEDHARLAAPGALLRLFGRSYMAVVDAGHAYYRPVVAASYALDARRWGVDPFGYHLTNVLLFAAVSALVYALFVVAGLERAIALAGALAFALHPALVAAVAWPRWARGSRSPRTSPTPRGPGRPPTRPSSRPRCSPRRPRSPYRSCGPSTPGRFRHPP